MCGNFYINDQNLISLKASKRAQAIASIGQFDGAPGDMRVKTRIAHGASHIEKISEEFKITHLLNKRLDELSGGQKKFVFIARCLVNYDAQVYILDEPQASLDASAEELLMSILQKRADLGKIIIVTKPA